MALKEIIDFGLQPHANAFLTPEEYKDEYFYRMVVGYDRDTGGVGLVYTNKREDLFNENYAFYSKTSTRMIEHFANTAKQLKRFVRDGVVVEIGSNDGIMQDAWKNLGVDCIGIEPSKNVCDLARANGHTVINEFLSLEVVEDLPLVDLVFAANVSCHTVDLDTYFASVAKMIGKHGVFVFEDPYFMDIYNKVSYDQFYGEHAWIFTVRFIRNMLAKHDLKVFDCENLWVHGGSMRFYVCHKDLYETKAVVDIYASKETDIEDKLYELKDKVEVSRKQLLNILEAVKGKNVAAFGATSKGVVITNYCNIGTDLISFVSDTTPTKIGKVYPGSHIPVVSQKEVDYSKIDYLVLFAWNHKEEIMKLNLGFKGKWITHVPYPQII